MKRKFFKVISFVIAIILIPFMSITLCAEEAQPESNMVDGQIQIESNSTSSQDYQDNSQNNNENNNENDGVANGFDFSGNDILETIQKYFKFEVDEEKTPYGILVYRGKNAGYEFSLYYSEEEKKIDTVLVGEVDDENSVDDKLATVNLSDIKTHLNALEIQNVYFAPNVKNIKENFFNSIPFFAVKNIEFLTDEKGNSAIKKIGNYAFSGIFANDASLTIDLPVGLEKIGKKAFYADKDKTNITVRVPYTVTNIAEDAFEGVTNVIMVDRPVEIPEKQDDDSEKNKKPSPGNSGSSEATSSTKNTGRSSGEVTKTDVALKNPGDEASLDKEAVIASVNSNNSETQADTADETSLGKSSTQGDDKEVPVSAADTTLLDTKFKEAKEGQTITIDMSTTTSLKAESLAEFVKLSV